MTFRHLLLALLLCLPAHVVFASDTQLGNCDLKNVFGVTDKKVYLDFDTNLRNALKSGDPTALAVLIQFPLRIYTPEGGSFSINDAQTLQLRYDEIVPKSVRDAVLNQNPTQLWCRDAGAEYNDDHIQVNIDQFNIGSTKEFRVTGIDFLSGKSRELPKTMRGINFICHTPKYRIVVDADSDNSEASLRYRAWIKPHGVTDKPDMEIIGGENESGGTGVCGYGAWTFKNGKTQYAVSELGCTDGSEPKGSIGSVAISKTDNPDNPIETLWCF